MSDKTPMELEIERELETLGREAKMEAELHTYGRPVEGGYMLTVSDLLR